MVCDAHNMLFKRVFPLFFFFYFSANFVDALLIMMIFTRKWVGFQFLPTKTFPSKTGANTSKTGLIIIT